MGLPRTSDSNVLFTTYNLLDLFVTDSTEAEERYEKIVASIRELGTDILAVQELRGADSKEVTGRLRRLADDVGMRCLVITGGIPAGLRQPALAMGSRGFHSALLWRGEIEPVTGSLRTLGRGYFWHSMAIVTLDVGGHEIRHAAFHATPFGRLLRADQNERLVALAAPSSESALLIGADWNTQSADRVWDEAAESWVLHEPDDPYSGRPWSPEMIYQCDWAYDERGQRRHWVDRHPGDVLWSGGLHDAAAVLGVAAQPTVGHFPGDRYAKISRRIDGVRVSPHLLDALRAHHVTDTELTRQASDHLPVTVEYDPAAVAGEPPLSMAARAAQPGGPAR